MALLRSDFRALARKYRLLAELRHAVHLQSAFEVRGPMRGLAREFPGALRELDALPLQEIERRAALFERAAERGVADEAWMEWMHRYHLTMRAALSVKRSASGQRSVSVVEARRIALRVGRECAWPCDEEFVFAVLRPRHGRISLEISARLEGALGLSPGALLPALFPRP